MHTKVKLTKKQQEAHDYNKWLRSLEKMAPKFARQTHAASSSLLEYKLTTPPGRPLSTQKSVVTKGHSTAPVPAPQYSGTKMLGIGVLHKSNSVPVFAEEDAKDIARMRR